MEGAFQEQLKRTVYIDNLSHNIMESVLQKAVEQFGTVVSIKICKDERDSRRSLGCALVEVEHPEQAEHIVTTLDKWLFMLGGMPRPVRVSPAVPEMLDRSLDVQVQVECPALHPRLQDRRGDLLKKLTELADEHAKEKANLEEAKQREEEELHAKQEETYRQDYQKLNEIQKQWTPESQELRRRFGMKVNGKGRF
eukprot:TRINITY_DN22227_c0_g1_i1.p1 TRINITY_DN22227_c0_g1~~TRINITY_DN22227_c0_g1_i1.p1  ORF type:complete len:196 (-),score=64.46 TRINITY_DN22227_c0_g1_i1:600-1187(-)